MIELEPRVLLAIDDEPAILEVVKVCLEITSPWQVVGAATGHEGLTAAAQQRPDGILLDISLPDLSGFEVLEKLQSCPSTQTIPVILLTANVQRADLGRYSTLQIAGILAKPFDPMRLAPQIATYLGWSL
ncbi:MAG: response regulator [Oscillatoriales cyanobacterium SM2_1_8]|nr:response regulator [Oscillatoriales cyanobacterium SM2_1_8]